MAIKVCEVELSRPIEAITGLDGYAEIRLLLKIHGFAVGEARVPVTTDRLEAALLIEAVIRQAGWAVLTHIMQDNLLAQTGLGARRLPTHSVPTEAVGGLLDGLKDELRQGLQVGQHEPACVAAARAKAGWLVSVVVCTRDGAARIEACLDALEDLDYPEYEIIIIDNAPTDDAIWRILQRRGAARYRYIVEPRPSISWARNRAIHEAKGDIIAFTDDDARPDRLWLLALVAGLQRPGISLVAGCAYPLDLQTDLHILLEKYSGRERGFERQTYSTTTPRFPKQPYHAHNLGGSYNLAAWHADFVRVGCFDPALEHNAGSDADLLYRLLRQGYTIAYEPTALIRMAYASDVQHSLRHSYLGASGLFAFLTKCWQTEPHNRPFVLAYAARVLWHYSAHLSTGDRLTRHFHWANLRGALAGPRNYRKAKKEARS